MDLNFSLTHSTQSPHTPARGVNLAHLSQGGVTENQRQKLVATEQAVQLGLCLVGPKGTRLLKGIGAPGLGSWVLGQRRVWPRAEGGTSLIPSFLCGDITRVKSGSTG